MPFHKFADLVKTQVQKLNADGHSEVAFRVAVKDGKVNFTARAHEGRVGLSRVKREDWEVERRGRMVGGSRRPEGHPAPDAVGVTRSW